MVDFEERHGDRRVRIDDINRNQAPFLYSSLTPSNDKQKRKISKPKIYFPSIIDRRCAATKAKKRYNLVEVVASRCSDLVQYDNMQIRSRLGLKDLISKEANR